MITEISLRFLRLAPRAALLLSLALALILPPAARAEAPSAALDPAKFSFQPVAGGLSEPVFITHAGDGSGRLFIVEQTGAIRIVKNGSLLGTPFLDIHTLIKSGGEQGLLALAFHPSYSSNGTFYVAYTAPRNGDSIGSNLVLEKFTVSANPDAANPASGVILLSIPHPTYTNHNGGTLAFGADGYLYWSTGDGGSGGDPANNAQQLNNLLGKILRLDVDSGSPYTIPPDNPFVSSSDPAVKKEIWAYGLRNPWRMSFDRQTHDLYIGDVGQGQREEVDFQPAASAGGENYGWRVMEGTLCYNPSSGCSTAGKILPVTEYDHTLGCAITGGYVYRGSKYPSLRGYYFYGDYCSGRLWSLIRSPGWTTAQLLDTDYSISSFGEDEQGELYLADYSGTVYQIQYRDGLPSGWVGSVAVSSDHPLAAVGRPHVGAEVASYDGVTGGGLTAYAPMLFKDAFGGTYDAALYVQNVDAANTADISIQFYDSAGALTCTIPGSVAPLASSGWWLPAVTCLPAGWVGGAVITSNHDIVAVGRPHVGAEVMTYNGFGAGNAAAYLPMLFKGAFGGSYNAAFYVQNVDGANTANLTLKFYDSAGALTCSFTDNLAPLASKGWWTPDLSCLPAGWAGGAVVTADTNIVSIGRVHVGAQITAYSGFASGNTGMVVPMLFKTAFGGSYNAAFYVQNLDAGSTATLSIKFYDSAGNLTCTLPDTVAPLASKGWWLPAVGCLPAGWVGGAVVTSDTDIVAVGRPHIGAQVTTYPAIASGGTSQYLPMLFRSAFGGTYDSAFYLQNTDAADAAVTLKFYDTDGNLTCTRADTIPARATLGYWLPSVICQP